MQLKLCILPTLSRSAEVVGAVGQGTGYACKGTSYSVGKGMEESVPIENCDTIGPVPITPRAFVDDGAIINKGHEEAKENGERVTRAMAILSLKPNQSKSAVIIAGG